MKRVLPLTLAFLALTACGTTQQEETTDNPTSEVTKQEAVQQEEESQAPTEVTFKATATGNGSVNWAGNGETHSEDFNQTYEVTVPVQHEYDFVSFTVSDNASLDADWMNEEEVEAAKQSVVTCQTIVNGEVVEEKNGTGGMGTASCNFPVE